MPKLHHVRIRIPDGHAVLSTVEIDGVPLLGVTFVKVEVGIPEKHDVQVWLRLFADVEIEGEAEIVKEWRHRLAPHDAVAHEEHTARTSLWPPPTPVPGCDACKRQADA